MACFALAATLAIPRTVSAGYERSFEAGSLIIPMDLAYQDHGLFQAYGLLFHLLRHGVRVYWVIDPDKTWHGGNCNTAGSLCAWDCAEEDSGVKCPYPTASPDFYTSATVISDGEGQASPGSEITNHGYRAGPFVIDVADQDLALSVINAWNDPGKWGAEPWAERAVFHVVTVHRASAPFSGYVRKEMIAAPTIAVFADGNENIATSYLRAAGIPQSNGAEFPELKCLPDTCGPGTANPDLLTVPDLIGDMGTCDAINYDHENGALFTSDGLPAYCQLMSMHWNVNSRETVECDGGLCPATEGECTGQQFTYHGHEVVAEVRQFLKYPVHFFAQCQSVAAFENATPNSAWPYLDDDARDGHFLTTLGSPPPCSAGECSDPDFGCVPGGCSGGTVDCCIPLDTKVRGAGLLIAERPDTMQLLNPGVAYIQHEGPFDIASGSEPAYKLSSFLGSKYKNDREVALMVGPAGLGEQDVWITGFLDGECDVGDDDVVVVGECKSAKISYLGGHAYNADVPVTGDPARAGTRLFLNALFEADCVTSVGQPAFAVSIDGDIVISTQTLPVERTYTFQLDNQGRGPAVETVLTAVFPDAVAAAAMEAGGSAGTAGVSWEIGSVSGTPPLAGDPPNQDDRWVTLRFSAEGEFALEPRIEYRVGLSEIHASPPGVTIRVLLDADGDGVADGDDPDPDDPHVCGDTDDDTCDDCAVAGQQDPANDGPDSDGDGLCDAGDPDAAGEGDKGGCGCITDRSLPELPWWLAFLVLAVLVWRRHRCR